MSKRMGRVSREPVLLDSTDNGIPLVMPLLGFELTHLSCLPCASRIEVDSVASDDVIAWVLEHREHINEAHANERWIPTPRELWRSRR